MHEIAQRIAPASRVVYVDNDPIVLSHARALLTSAPEGACAYIDADARDPERILADSRLRATLDLSKPTALMFFGIMHFLPDEADPHGIVSRLLGALPSGSYLAIQQPTADFYPPGVGGQAAYRGAGIAFQYRTKDEFARFLDGLELIQPGITPMADWRPEIEPGPGSAPPRRARTRRSPGSRRRLVPESVAAAPGWRPPGVCISDAKGVGRGSRLTTPAALLIPSGILRGGVYDDADGWVSKASTIM